MTLTRKFVALVGALGLAVALNLGMGLFSIALLQRELSAPLVAVERIAQPLAELRRAIGGQRAMLEEPRTARTAEALERHIRGAEAALGRLEPAPATIVRAALGPRRNLQQRVRRAAADVLAWAGEGDESARASALAQLQTIDDIARLTESRVLGDTMLAVEYGRQVRGRVLVVLGASLAIAVVTGILAVLLLRRWIVRPVGELRLATERFGAGALDYRIPVPGGRADEMADLGREVNAMAATIERMQAERIERERLAAVGAMVRRIVHNLRNPLSGIRTLAELTASGACPAPEMRENQQRIMGAVDRFDTWLTDLLDITRPLEIRPARCPVGAWLEQALAAPRAGAGERAVDLRVDAGAAPETACFDPRHLEQALVALVANAASASAHGGVVEVRAEREAPGGPGVAGGSWRLSVTDSGPGVPPDIRERIFEPYFTTRPDGNGIGLAVVHRVVAQHGGRVWVEDAGGGEPDSRGSRFIIELPLEPPVGAGRTVAGQAGEPGSAREEPGGANPGH